MGMLPNVLMCVLQCVGVCFALRMAEMALVSNYVFVFFFLGKLISLFCIFKVWKFLFRSAPLIINTSVNKLCGTKQDTCRYKYNLHESSFLKFCWD